MIPPRLFKALLILLLASLIRPALALPIERLVQLGDSAYARRAYDSAAHYYSQATAGYDPDAVVLYKLGNAHYRLGNNGEAVLAYERALQRKPGFTAAADNVSVIQQRIQPERGKGDVFFIRWWQQLTKPARSNTWALLGVLCFCVPIGALIWSRFMRRWPAWLWPHAVVGGIAFSLLFAVLAAASVTGPSRDTGVIMKQDAAFYADTKSGGKQVTINLPEGLLVKVLANEGGRLRVLLPDGREGLAQPSDIALVR